MAAFMRNWKKSSLLMKIAVNCELNFLRYSCTHVKLAEVGCFEEPKLTGNYESGQLFLHRIFGYRGAVSFPWQVRVYDRDMHKKTIKSHARIVGRDCNSSIRKINGSVKPNLKTAIPTPLNEMKPEKQTYYQVLIDARDCPYVRVQTEAVTFLRNKDANRSFYSIPGLDYVSHDDIIPYTSTENQPLHHDLFDQFLMRTSNKMPPFEPRDMLKDWQVKNQAWLRLSEVHRQTTENVRVTVTPFYMGCREAPGFPVYWWRYSVRLENLGDMAVQLRERHWRIFSLSGTLETVRGRGVVGKEPVLCTRLPAFQYSSHVSLHVPSGHMWGTLRFEREDGYTFDCKVPPFSLDSQPEEGSTIKPFNYTRFTSSGNTDSEE